MLGIPLASRLMLKDPGLGLRLLVDRRRSASPARGSRFALAPVLWVAVAIEHR